MLEIIYFIVGWSVALCAPSMSVFITVIRFAVFRPLAKFKIYVLQI